MKHDQELGEAIIEEEENELRRYILKKMLGDQGNYHRFPGSQPVSLDRSNLSSLQKKRYWCTWKADGTRYMLLILQYGTYIIDRSFRIRRLQMRFPLYFVDSSIAPTYNNARRYYDTILDGEMIVDYCPDNKHYIRRYLIYDIILLNDQNMMNYGFHQRYEILKKFLSIRKIEKQKIIYNESYYKYKYEDEPFDLRVKSFYNLSNLPKVFKMMESISHECDGIILQSADDVYITGTCFELLKWKFSNLNSVDFRFVYINENAYDLLLLLSKNNETRLDGAIVEFPDGRNMREYHNKIIECSYNGNENKWIFMRVRMDKETPNAMHVYQKILKSIKDDIKKEELIHILEKFYKEEHAYEPDRNKF